MIELYDTKIKYYPDGNIRYSCNKIIIPYNNFSYSPAKDNKSKDTDIIRSKRNSLNRSVDKLYDIVHSNTWDYFFTLTLDPGKVDRYDFILSSNCVHHFTDLLYRSDCLYVIVPEKHKDGAWHFHGLLTNTDNLKLVVNDNGYFEFKQYNYGYCSLSRVVDTNKVANYILKYLIKGYDFLDIPKGKKRYWASRGLDIPDVEYDVLTIDQINDLLNKSYYYKKIDNDFYKGYIIDVNEN